MADISYLAAMTDEQFNTYADSHWRQLDRLLTVLGEQTDDDGDDPERWDGLS